MISFQSVLIQTGAKECLVATPAAHNESEMRKLSALLQRCEVMMTEVSRGSSLTLLECT